MLHASTSVIDYISLTVLIRLTVHVQPVKTMTSHSSQMLKLEGTDSTAPPLKIHHCCPILNRLDVMVNEKLGSGANVKVLFEIFRAVTNISNTV